jgi:predicted AAA+ superfamily ATPase
MESGPAATNAEFRGERMRKAFMRPRRKVSISRSLNLHLDAMTERSLHRRFAQSRLLEALADTPVVLIHGPRQCGKTTLARMVGDPKGYACFSFDDPVALEAAQSDPLGFVADLPEHSIL